MRTFPARRITPEELISGTLDPGSYESWDQPLPRLDIEAGYEDELEAARAKSGHDESVLTGQGTINGHPVAAILGEFRFLGGSIGVNAATRITDAIERATRLGLPLLVSPVSGGTRMQEGTVAFIQMARITGAVLAHKAAKLPYLVYLRHPTTGGVFASWGSLGHITTAQPSALVGFLGPKVYKALHGHDFPEGVQHSENLHRHGIIDAVLDPEHLRTFLVNILNVLYGKATGTKRPEPSPGEHLLQESTDPWRAVLASRDTDRPGLRTFLRHSATDLVPVSGFGSGGTAHTITVVLATIGGQGILVVGQDRRADPGMGRLGPDALREARRGMVLAEGLGLPLLTIIDTSGAALSREAEEGGLSREIAQSLAQMLTLQTPTVTLLLGQGTGGGALALFPADRIIAASNSWLAPLPPEGASTIVHADTGHAAVMARNQRIDASALLHDGIIHEVFDETEDPHKHPALFAAMAAAAVQRNLELVTASPIDTLLQERRHRYAGIGTRATSVARPEPVH